MSCLSYMFIFLNPSFMFTCFGCFPEADAHDVLKIAEGLQTQLLSLLIHLLIILTIIHFCHEMKQIAGNITPTGKLWPNSVKFYIICYWPVKKL